MICFCKYLSFHLVVFILIFSVISFLSFETYAAYGPSTVNPLLPVQNSPLQSSVVRNNFQSSYNDITNIYNILNGFGPYVSFPVPLPTQYGGTGLTAPGASGNVLTSNGSTWTSTGLQSIFLGTSASATAPRISDDATSGFYTPGAAQIAVSTGGVQRGLFNSSGFTANISPSTVLAPGTTTAVTEATTALTQINVKSFGAKGDGSTDDSASINAAITYIRNQNDAAGSGAYNKYALLFPQGYYNVSETLNFTCFSDPNGTGISTDDGCRPNGAPTQSGENHGFVPVLGYGAVLQCNTNGTPCIDGLGSRYLRINGLTLYGNCSTLEPSYGVQFGRTVNNITADHWYFHAVNFEGCYKKATFYNLASEQMNVDGNSWIVNAATSQTFGINTGPYNVIMDTGNHWGITSAFVNEQNPTDTTNSFNDNTFVGGSIYPTGNSHAGAMWIYGTRHLNLLNTYVVNEGGNSCYTIYYDATSAGNSHGPTDHAPQNDHFTAHCEGNVTNLFLITGHQSAPIISGLELLDHAIGPLNTTTNVFALDTGVTSLNLQNVDFDLVGGATTVNLWDTPAAYSVSGKIVMQGAGGDMTWVAPGTWTGCVQIGNNGPSCGPTIITSIINGAFSDTAPTNKGALRLTGNNGSAQSQLIDGGVEFETFSNYGWRIFNANQGNSLAPLIFQERTNASTWTNIMGLSNWTGTTSGGGVAIGTQYASLNVPLNSEIVQGQVSIGTSLISAGVSLDLGSNTNALLLPIGTTGNRPTGINGMLRYNSTATADIEGYINNVWTPLTTGGSAATITLGTTASLTNPQVSGDPTTGLFTSGANQVAVSSLGNQIATFGTPSGASTTSNFLNMAGTLVTPTATESGINASFVSVGTSGITMNEFANTSNLTGAYVGTGITAAYNGANSATGTSTAYTASVATQSYGPRGNFGFFNQATSVGAGINAGGRLSVAGSSLANYGLWTASTATGNTPALNVGLASFALNATTNTAGYFATVDLGTAAPTFSPSVITLNNGSSSNPLILGQVNAVTKFEVDNSGNVGIGTSTLLGNVALQSYNTSVSGGAYGVYGVSVTTGTGAGVYGMESGIGNTSFGVRGVNSDPDNGGYGVSGSNASTAFGVGTLGAETGAGNNGYGIYGLNTGVSGANFGVVGTTNTTAAGAGTYGSITGANNVGYGVYATNSSTTGWGVYSAAGRNYFSTAVGIGALNPLALLHFANGTSQSAWTTNGVAIREDAAIYTDTSSSGTVVQTNVNNIGAPTIAASGTVTFTNAITLNVQGAPIAGTNVTITNPFALRVVGNSTFSGLTGYGFSGASPISILEIAGNQSQPDWGVNGIGFNETNAIWNDTTSSGTVASNIINYIGAPVLTANSATTFTNAVNTYINGPPTASTNVTLTRGFALEVASGPSAFAGFNGFGFINVTPTAVVYISGNQSSPSWGVNGIEIDETGSTLTDTTSSGTVTNNMVNAIGASALAASSATTYTNAASLYIAGAPIAGTNVTLTNKYALDIGGGTSTFGGNVIVPSSAVGIGTATPNTGVALDLGSNTTTANSSLLLPIGTTGTRPATGINGMIRYNSTATPAVEAYVNNAWVALQSGTQAGSGAEQTISYQPGLLSAVNATKGVFGKFVKASTLDNIEGSAITFSCVSNPTITLTNCHTDTSCATTPTSMGTVTVTAAGQAFDGTITNAAILAGEYVAWSITAGTCASIDVSATAQVHAN